VTTSLTAHIEKRFAARPASEAFNLNVEFVAEPGITVLFGPSGAGKTLTLEALAGFSNPDTGKIQFGARTLFDSHTRIDVPARNRRCGYLFQQDALFPHMTVRENVAFGANPDENRVDQLLTDFRIDGLAGRRPSEISGGERQRCAIARTLASSPEFLLMDEPAQGLDIALRRELHSLFRRIREQFGLPMLLVTHDISEALALGDSLLLYSHGKIVQQGPPQHTFDNPNSVAAARLMGIESDG
jgi:molybdate transport system ATP-binding protein